MKRYALIRHDPRVDSVGKIARYLPGNYRVTWTTSERSDVRFALTVVEGEDDAGWTLHGYVLPRLASGVIFGEEIDLSHPVMQTVPLVGVHVVEPAGWVCDRHGYGPYGTCLDAVNDCEGGHPQPPHEYERPHDDDTAGTPDHNLAVELIGDVLVEFPPGTAAREAADEAAARNRPGGLQEDAVAYQLGRRLGLGEVLDTDPPPPPLHHPARFAYRRGVTDGRAERDERLRRDPGAAPCGCRDNLPCPIHHPDTRRDEESERAYELASSEVVVGLTRPQAAALLAASATPFDEDGDLVSARRALEAELRRAPRLSDAWSRQD